MAATIELLKVAEVARVARVTDATVRTWIHSGRLLATKTATGNWRVSIESLERFLNNRESACQQ